MVEERGAGSRCGCVLDACRPANQSAASLSSSAAVSAVVMSVRATSTICRRRLAAADRVKSPRPQRLRRPDPHPGRDAGHQRHEDLDEVHLRGRDGLVQRAVVEFIRVATGGGASAEVPAGCSAFLVEQTGKNADDRDGVQSAEDGHLHHETFQTLDAAAVAAYSPTDAVHCSEPGREEADSDGEADGQRNDDEFHEA